MGPKMLIMLDIERGQAMKIPLYMYFMYPKISFLLSMLFISTSSEEQATKKPTNLDKLLINSLTTIGYLLEVIFKLYMDNFFGLYFHFCLELALET